MKLRRHLLDVWVLLVLTCGASAIVAQVREEQEPEAQVETRPAPEVREYEPEPVEPTGSSSPPVDPLPTPTDSSTDNSSEDQSCRSEENGIVVGQVKVYDERSLRLLLQAAENRLAALTFIDAGGLTAGKIQGGRLRSSQFGISAEGLPTPKVVTTVDEAADATTGDIVTTTDVVTTQESQSPEIPQASSSTRVLPTPTAESISLSARDLLAEQVALTYEVATLRLALERAISDRIVTGVFAIPGTNSAVPAKQTLLGFQVSIDPKHTKAIAEVEVILQETGGLKRPSIVNLLPSRSTYNVAAITQKGFSFGLGTITNVFNIGIAGAKKQETYYIVQDVDTVALELPSSDPAARFGWQFRPVLGRKAVDTGRRQLFVHLVLPNRSSISDASLTIKVKTRWRKWSRSDMIAKDRIKGEESCQKDTIQVLDVFDLQALLRPEVTRISWSHLDNGKAFVNVRGSNFLRGTRVFNGESTIDESNGLRRGSENELSFVTSLASISSPQGLRIQAPYGVTQVTHPAAELAGQLEVTSTTAEIVAASKLRLCIQAQNIVEPQESLVHLDDKIFHVGDGHLTVGPDPCTLALVTDVATIRKASHFALVSPFWGPSQYTLFDPGFDDFSVTSVRTLAKRKMKAVLGVEGTGFDDEIIVDLGGVEFEVRSAEHPLTRRGSTFLELKPTWPELEGLQRVVVRKPDSFKPVILKIDASEVTLPVPRPELSNDVSTFKGDRTTLEIPGENLGGIAQVFFFTDPLEIDVDLKRSVLKVRVSEKLSKDVGTKELTVVLKDDKKTKVFFRIKVLERPSSS